MFLTLIGVAVAGATYAYAKKRGARTRTAAAAATTTGLGSAVVGSLMLASASIVLPLAAVGGIGYFFYRRGQRPRALRAGR